MLATAEKTAPAIDPVALRRAFGTFVTGVTGARQELSPGLSEFVARVRAQTDTPLAVGFGIGTGSQAQAVAQIADGIIVGSALVKRAGESVQAVQELARELREALQAFPEVKI